MLDAWKRAKDALREPQAAFALINDLIRDKYHIAPQDSVDLSTGRIIRAGSNPL